MFHGARCRSGTRLDCHWHSVMMMMMRRRRRRRIDGWQLLRWPSCHGEGCDQDADVDVDDDLQQLLLLLHHASMDKAFAMTMKMMVNVGMMEEREMQRHGRIAMEVVVLTREISAVPFSISTDTDTEASDVIVNGGQWFMVMYERWL